MVDKDVGQYVCVGFLELNAYVEHTDSTSLKL